MTRSVGQNPGEPARGRRSVRDRQHASRRLLFEAVEEVFDPDVDIDWDHPPAEGATWMPDELCSLYGTTLFDTMPADQRNALVTAECAEILVYGMRLDTVAAMTAFKTIARDRELQDDRARFLFAAVNDLSRNVSMYSRILDIIGVEPVVARRRSGLPARVALFAPRKSVAFSLMLLSAGFLRSLAASGGTDTQPHLRHLLEIQAGASDRVTRFVLEELIEEKSTSSTWRPLSVRYVLNSTALAWLVTSVGEQLISDAAYAAAGLDPALCRSAASHADIKGPRMRRLLAAVLDACDRGDLLDSAPARYILRRNGIR